MAVRWKRTGAAAALALALSGCHTLYGWGGPTPTVPGATTPTAIAEGRTWTSIDTNEVGTCGITAASRLWCEWGGTERELLVPGTTANDPADWEAVGMGRDHVCATTGTGELWCLGDNSSGQLGIGPTPTFTTGMVRVGTASDWTSVRAGGTSTCGLRGSGALWCWGSWTGDGTSTVRTAPTPVGAGTSWAAVDVGSGHTCATTAGGQLWCWGGGGVVGNGTTDPALAPVRIGTATDWTTVSVGHSHACGLRGTGALWCWGANRDGELGDGSITARRAPQRVGVAADWTAVSAGGADTVGGSGGGLERLASHTCAIRGGGELWCWGANAWSELGDGTTTDRTTPTRIGGEADWVAVSAGGGFTRGLQADG